MNLPDAALLDTNVLLLRLAALTDISLLKTYKRVQNFNAIDVDLLNQVLKPFNRLVSTPHVLAEASNFIGQAPHYRRTELVETLRDFVHQCEERYEPARTLVNRTEFGELGLADTGLVALSKDVVVITTDSGLWANVAKLGGLCINFTHIRASAIRARVR